MLQACYLDQLCNLCWCLEHNPLVHCDRLLPLVSLHGDISPKEQQREGRDHGGIVDKDLRALHFCVIDEKLVHKMRFIGVH